MRPPLHPQLRRILSKHPAGMDVASLAKLIDSDPATVRRSLRSCYGAYVIAWQQATTGVWSQCWAVVPVPPHAIKPK